MSKSKSHPCQHPKTARRYTDPEFDLSDFYCVKCNQKVDGPSERVIKVSAIQVPNV